MIRRPHDNGYLLITQPAHAWLSGQLAQHWGAVAEACPNPYQAVVLATTLHDVGWLEKDDTAILTDDGQPLSFLEPKLDDVEAMYARCVSDLHQIDPYAEVLVNKHIQTIYNSRATHKRDPIERLQPLLDQLTSEEKTTVDHLQSHPIYSDYADEQTIMHNYRILRTCDLLSLFVCGAFPAKSVNDVPQVYGQSGMTIDCTLLNRDTLKVTPRIFDQDTITVPIEAKIIPQATYQSIEVYRDAFNHAKKVTLQKTITSV